MRKSDRETFWKNLAYALFALALFAAVMHEPKADECDINADDLLYAVAATVQYEGPYPPPPLSIAWEDGTLFSREPELCGGQIKCWSYSAYDIAGQRVVLNRALLQYEPPATVCQWIAHEMVHHLQHATGELQRLSFHARELRATVAASWIGTLHGRGLIQKTADKWRMDEAHD